MNPLELEIRALIEQDGPLSIADYMALCLAHPQHGYYTTGHPVGGRASANRTGGDFITAPEVSQIFGEMIAVWCMEMWQKLGSPPSFNLVETGPGRGTLMKDLLRVSRALPDFLKAAEVYLVEISPTLSEQQSLTLSDSDLPVTWVRDVQTIPQRPTILIANELLDALPFHQWVKTDQGWREKAVGLKDGALVFTTRPATLAPTSLPADHHAAPVGTIYETAPAREGFVATIAQRLKTDTGAALFIDYGHISTGFGDTLQAVRGHGFANPLLEPGKSDITSHVDFAPLLSTARLSGCVAPEPVTQGAFLISLGLLERAGNLGTNKPASVQQTLQSAVERLAEPDKMGDLFKVMAFGAPASLDARWPGFA